MSGVLDKQYIFIIGAPRSGSTWLQKIIGSHPRVASTEAELTLFNRYVKPFVDQFTIEEKPVLEGKWQQGLPHLFTRQEIETYIQQFLATAYSKIDAPGATHILDKHPHYSETVDLINHYFPNAKFINIIRDGREAALSWHKVSQSNDFGARSLQKAARDWKKFVQNAANARKFGPDRYIEIMYKEILLQPETSVSKIFSFCNLPYDEVLVKTTIEKTFGQKNMVSAPTSGISPEDRVKGQETWNRDMLLRDRINFNDEAGDLLLEYGFEKDKKWVGNPFSIALVRFLRFFGALWRKLKKSVGAFIYG